MLKVSNDCQSDAVGYYIKDTIDIIPHILKYFLFAFFTRTYTIVSTVYTQHNWNNQNKYLYPKIEYKFKNESNVTAFAYKMLRVFCGNNKVTQYLTKLVYIVEHSGTWAGIDKVMYSGVTVSASR